MTSKNCHLNETLNGKKIAFIGAGNMAQAIINGLIESGIKPNSLYCSNPGLTKLDKLKVSYPGINTSQKNSDIAKQADILVLAVKPQVIAQALNSIAALDLSDKLIISVAAGVETQSISQLLQQDISLVRAMPNTPASIGMGATGLFANEKVCATKKTFSECIFNAVGTSVWIEHESQMDLVTAISGSGPAHYFLFLESVIQSAIEQGMAAETAKKLAIQTALGAASMAAQDPKHDIRQLRENVTSPGGTTAAAIESFQNNHFAEIIEKALKASVNRGKKLSAMIEHSDNSEK